MAESHKDYTDALDLLAHGNIEQFEAAEKHIEHFPHGVDNYIQRQWITNAIDCGSVASVKWMLSRGVDLSFRDSEGYTPLLSALERNVSDRYIILQLLIDSGAPINQKGVNDWTPLHMAAAREDIEALKILIKHGADLSIRTDIDDYATPLEEAQILNKQKSVKYLLSITQSE